MNVLKNQRDNVTMSIPTCSNKEPASETIQAFLAAGPERHF
jgi:hypothetical protein